MKAVCRMRIAAPSCSILPLEDFMVYYKSKKKGVPNEKKFSTCWFDDVGGSVRG